LLFEAPASIRSIIKSGLENIPPSRKTNFPTRWGQTDGDELAEISRLIDAGEVKPKVTKTFPLQSAAQALDAVGHGHSEGKIVLTVD
jgi:NADPH:quinone reductase-like Zn-dependent oxidoreductase